MVEHQPFQWTTQLLGLKWLPKQNKLPFDYKYPSKFKDIKAQLFLLHHFHRLDERQEESRPISRLQANSSIRMAKTLLQEFPEGTSYLVFKILSPNLCFCSTNVLLHAHLA